MPYLRVDVGFEDSNWPDWEVAVSSLITENRREGDGLKLKVGKLSSEGKQESF